MRGLVKRMRPAEKAKQKGTEEKESTDAKEDLEAKEQGSMRRMSGFKWRLTWEPVAHTPRPW